MDTAALQEIEIQLQQTKQDLLDDIFEQQNNITFSA
jgi:hypothetical protein